MIEAIMREHEALDSIMPIPALSQFSVLKCDDIRKSGTRKEELLLSKEKLQKIWLLRRALASQPSLGAVKLVISKLKKTKTNQEFLDSIKEQDM